MAFKAKNNSASHYIHYAVSFIVNILSFYIHYYTLNNIKLFPPRWL